MIPCLPDSNLRRHEVEGFEYWLSKHYPVADRHPGRISHHSQEAIQIFVTAGPLERKGRFLQSELPGLLEDVAGRQALCPTRACMLDSAFAAIRVLFVFRNRSAGCMWTYALFGLSPALDATLVNFGVVMPYAHPHSAELRAAVRAVRQSVRLTRLVPKPAHRWN